MQKETLLRAVAGAALCAALIVGYFWIRAPDATFVKVGDAAPDLDLPAFGSPAHTKLSSFRGRPVLVVFFLSGCHICNAEIEQIEKVHRRFLWDGLVVLGVAVDETKDAAAGSIKDFVARHGLTFLVLEDHDNEAVFKAYRSQQMPEAYLIDAKGTVDAVYLGSVHWQSNEVYDRIKKLLPPPPRPASKS